MITIDDLKIGNWVIYDGKRSIIAGLLDDSVDGNKATIMSNPDGKSSFVHIYKLEPIVLTEELLLNFDFEATPYKTGYMLWFIKNMEGLLIEKERSFIYAVGDVCSIEHVKYLHQLQNLYYSLTGKDIMINKLL